MAIAGDRLEIRTKKADYLVDQKYGRRDAASGAWNASEREQEEYREALLAMPKAEFDALYEAVRNPKRSRSKIRAEERARIFNQPRAQADFSHWSKAAHWTLDEAVALSLGKSPGIVNWALIKPYVGVSEFAGEFGRVRELAQRARAARQLTDPVLPGSFIAWARGLDVSFPEELEAAVRARGSIDSETAYDRLKGQYDDLVVKFAETEQSVSEIRDNRDTLQRKVAGLEAQIAATPKEKSFSTRERETLLKIALGAAMQGYGYDPKQARNKTTSEIAGDLATLGIPVSEDTILKKLQEAASLLPQGAAG